MKAQDIICNGSNPSIAISDNGQVILVYNQPSNVMKYWTGTVDERTEKITWVKEECNFTDGKFPSVSMEDNKILVAFQKESHVHYSLGIMESNGNVIWKIIFDNMQSKGFHPTMSMNGDLAVVIYNSGPFSSNLLTQIGTISEDSISWGTPQNDTKDTGSSDFSGEHASIALLRDEDSTVVATYQTGVAAGRKLFARCGKAQKDERKIVWHEENAGNFIFGCYSSVTPINERTFIEMHCTNILGGEGIWFHVCKVDKL